MKYLIFLIQKDFKKQNERAKARIIEEGDDRSWHWKVPREGGEQMSRCWVIRFLAVGKMSVSVPEELLCVKSLFQRLHENRVEGSQSTGLCLSWCSWSTGLHPNEVGSLLILFSDVRAKSAQEVGTDGEVLWSGSLEESLATEKYSKPFLLGRNN